MKIISLPIGALGKTDCDEKERWKYAKSIEHAPYVAIDTENNSTIFDETKASVI